MKGKNREDKSSAPVKQSAWRESRSSDTTAQPGSKESQQQQRKVDPWPKFLRQPAKKVEEESEEESTDESEDSDAELLTPDLEANVIQTIQKIRTKDPEIYQKDKVFFNRKENAQADDNQEVDKKKKEKPMMLKDYLREELLAGRVQAGDEVEDDLQHPGAKGRSYVQEQEDAKRAFIDSARKQLEDDADSSDDGLLKRRKEQRQVEAASLADTKMSVFDETKTGKSHLVRYFADDKLEEDERFLRDYVMNESWKDKDKGRIPSYNEIVDVDEDAEFLEKAEEFEQAYNFRSEEPGGAEIVSYPRFIEDSVRVNPRREKRKQQREEKKARKDAEKVQMQEQLKRQKALKRKEIEKRLKMIMEVGGFSDADAQRLAQIDLEGEWDPETYEKMMARAFDDEYYEKQDGEALTAVPETSAVKEILKAEESDDSEESETEDKEEADEDVDEVVSKPALVAPRTEEDGDSDADFEGEGIIHRPGTAGHAGDVDGADDDFAGDVQKLGRHMKVPLEKYLQDLDKMDYEDVLADGFKTRFKYREIEPKRYGLSVEEILELDDKSLNRHVSIKRLAPYRDDADMTEGMYRNKKRKLNADAQEMEKKMFKKELKRKERHVQEKAQELGISADTYEAYQLSSKSSKSKSEVEAVQKRMRQMKEQAKRERRKERDNAEKKKKKQEAQA